MINGIKDFILFVYDDVDSVPLTVFVISVATLLAMTVLGLVGLLVGLMVTDWLGRVVLGLIVLIVWVVTKITKDVIAEEEA
jgi:xanthosine utilization system XapX-like protein